MDNEKIRRGEETYKVEAFTLLSISVLVTALRTYYRARIVGIKRFQADDYFVLVGLIFLALGTCLSYSTATVSHGIANNSMTDEYRARLSPDSHEYHLRVLGSKIHSAGWPIYICAIWSYKVAVCTFYLRLVSGLWKFRRRIMIGFAAIGIGWIVAILSIFLSCRPLHRLRQINPNPGNSCQPAISTPILVTPYVCNIVTDLYLISIPLPIIFEFKMRLRMKVGLGVLFGCAIFIVIAATIRLALTMTHPAQSAGLSGPWAMREVFVASMVTNFPVLFPLFKRWVYPFLRSSWSLLPHPMGQTGWRGKKAPGQQLVGNNENDDRRHQGDRAQCPNFKASRRSAKSGIWSSWYSQLSDLYQTTVRSLDVSQKGSRLYSGVEDIESSREPIALRGRYMGRGRGSTLNRTDSRGSDWILTPVPPCKIRRDVEVSVEEGRPTSSSYGNFTSVWGQKQNPQGPDIPVGMRTPYLLDHLEPMKPGTGSRQSSYTSKLIG